MFKSLLFTPLLRQLTVITCLISLMYVGKGKNTFIDFNSNHEHYYHLFFYINIMKSLLLAIIVCSKQYNDFQNLIQYKNR